MALPESYHIRVNKARAEREAQAEQVREFNDRQRRIPPTDPQELWDRIIDLEDRLNAHVGSHHLSYADLSTRY